MVKLVQPEGFFIIHWGTFEGKEFIEVGWDRPGNQSVEDFLDRNPTLDNIKKSEYSKQHFPNREVPQFFIFLDKWSQLSP